MVTTKKTPSKTTKFKLRPSLFWDVDPKTIDLKKHARYVIERVMDFGRDEEVRWMRKTYMPDQLREVAKKSRSLMPQSKALWLLLTDKKK